AADEREVLAFERTRLHQRLQALVRLLALGDHEQSRRVAVEPVNDPRSLRVTAGEARDALRERPGGMSRSGMDDQTGGLVDDREVLVLVRDPQVEGRGLGDGRCRLLRELDVLSPAPPGALRL